MFHWEPEGPCRCTKSMAIAPFWFSMEHLWIVIVPFWFSMEHLWIVITPFWFLMEHLWIVIAPFWFSMEHLWIVIAPFWFSMEHLWIVIAPFWLSTDNIWNIERNILFSFCNMWQMRKLFSMTWNEIVINVRTFQGSFAGGTHCQYFLFFHPNAMCSICKIRNEIRARMSFVLHKLNCSHMSNFITS